MINMAFLLRDPDIANVQMIRVRRAQTIGDNGRAINTSSPSRITGTVTMDKGAVLKRIPEGEYVEGSILVHAPACSLRVAGIGYDADLVQWKGASYTVKTIGDYSSQGFMWAVCEPVSIPGV